MHSICKDIHVDLDSSKIRCKKINEVKIEQLYLFYFYSVIIISLLCFNLYFHSHARRPTYLVEQMQIRKENYLCERQSTRIMDSLGSHEEETLHFMFKGRVSSENRETLSSLSILYLRIFPHGQRFPPLGCSSFPGP